MRNMPVEHSKFLWDIVSYISNLQTFFDFAIGCGIPSHMVRKAIEDNDPSDDDIFLEECVVHALTVWWLSTNRSAIWKSDKNQTGFCQITYAWNLCLSYKETSHLRPNTTRANTSKWPTTRYKWTDVHKTRKVF